MPQRAQHKRVLLHGLLRVPRVRVPLREGAEDLERGLRGAGRGVGHGEEALAGVELEGPAIGEGRWGAAVDGLLVRELLVEDFAEVGGGGGGGGRGGGGGAVGSGEGGGEGSAREGGEGCKGVEEAGGEFGGTLEEGTHGGRGGERVVREKEKYGVKTIVSPL